MSKQKDNKFDNYSLRSFPMIKGKVVNLKQAISEINRILKTSSSIHIDGMDCDISSIDKALRFAEKKKCSINHKSYEKINNLYITFQKFGGSLVSFNELKNRSDFILLVGSDDISAFHEFVEKLKWKKDKVKKSIFFLGKKKAKEKTVSNIVESKGENIFHDINSIYVKLNEKKINKKDRLYKIINALLCSEYPAIVININQHNLALILSVYDFVYSVNESKRLKIFNFFGSDNASGFINACVTKTGFPNAVIFSEKGAEYEPYQIKSSLLKENVDLQIYISNFENNPEINYFKKNIFIGNPNLKKKKKFDVYIPTQTPGVDKNGVIVHSDGISVIKLKKLINSSYKSVEEILNKVLGS
jgi:formylmethanofuran dehydrogenase subunit B